MEYIKANLWEIKNSSSLRYFAMALSISHILTYCIWRNSPGFSGQNTICWNFLPACNETLFFAPPTSSYLLTSYLVLAGIAALCFISFRFLALGYFALVVVTLLNFVLYMRDYSLATDLNALLIILSFFLTLIPQKVRVIRATLISSFFVSGLLKLNKEWLAGYWLSQHLPPSIPIKGIEWIAAITLFAELVVPLFLLSRQTQRFFTGFSILLFYTLLKSYIVGPLPTLIQVLFLIFFVMWFFEEDRIARESLYRSFIRPEPSKIWVVVTLLLFWSLQAVVGRFVGDKSLILPLQYQKLPIPIECRHQTIAHFKSGKKHLDESFVVVPSENLRCQPFIYLNAVRDLCPQYKAQPDFEKISTYFLKRSVSDREYTRVFAVENICDSKAQDLSFPWEDNS